MDLKWLQPNFQDVVTIWSSSYIKIFNKLGENWGTALLNFIWLFPNHLGKMLFQLLFLSDDLRKFYYFLSDNKNYYVSLKHVY